MEIAILTFDGFNELDSFIVSSIINRMKPFGWNAYITCPTRTVTSMNNVVAEAQQPIEFANTADVVLFGSGTESKKIANDKRILSRLELNSNNQMIASQCSGALLMAKLGLLNGLPVCTDLSSRADIIEAGLNVLDRPFVANGNIATAGGCLAAQYLATWVIFKIAGKDKVSSVLQSVAPVGENKRFINNCLSIVAPYIQSL